MAKIDDVFGKVPASILSTWGQDFTYINMYITCITKMSRLEVGHNFQGVESSQNWPAYSGKSWWTSGQHMIFSLFRNTP